MHKRGFNLIEIAIVLAVIGLVIGGIYVAAAAVTERQRQSKTITQMMTIVTNMRSIYAGRSAVEAMTPDALIATRIVPSDMQVVSNDLRGSYGIVRITPSATIQHQYDLWFQNLSSGACTALLSATVGNAAVYRDMRGLGVSTELASTVVAPASVDTIAAACAAERVAVNLAFSIR